MSEIVLELPGRRDDLLGRLIRKINVHIAWTGSAGYLDANRINVNGHPEPVEKNNSASGQSEHMQRASEILDRYGNSILRMAYSYLHNMSDAEDILQDTLIQYIRTKPQLNGDEHEKAWLLRVACNLSKNKIKYNNLRETDELMEELAGCEEEDLSFVWEAVKQLPDKYREVIHLFYQEGYSTGDIANILRRNESTVRSDLNRARKQLKNILKEAYDFG